jgi:adenylate cyclase
MPSRRARTSATASIDGVRSATTRQRDRMVTGTSSGCSEGAQSRKTVRGGGSSSILSTVLDACSVIRSASSITMICQRPWDGARPAVRTIWRTSSTPMDSPSGTTRCTSAWLPASTVRQAWQVPSPPDGHCSAAANARAATERPEPGGPVNSQAWVIAVGCATAACSSATTAG